MEPEDEEEHRDSFREVCNRITLNIMLSTRAHTYLNHLPYL